MHIHRHYNPDAFRLHYADACTKAIILAVVTLTVSALADYINGKLLYFVDTEQITILVPFVKFLTIILDKIGAFLMLCGIISSICALFSRMFQSDAKQIKLLVERQLFLAERGNPLRLKEGELLPAVSCVSVDSGNFELTITATSKSIDDLVKLSPIISSALTGKRFERYAVTQVISDVAYNKVTYRVEDVTIDKSIVIHNVNEMKPTDNTKLIIQQGTFLDLCFSGSILAAGKTRSGKTTGIISILLQVLLLGRDDYDSNVLIIDPKQAELSRLPHVISIDADGEATQILAAIQRFADSITNRQQVLNDASQRQGNAVKWWQLGMKPSYIFLDEYVSLRSIIPKKADKTAPDYSLDAFDGLMRRIITMGASAGCFAIVSIAEASVQEGGLPSMLRSAMGTKILYKPTMPEARLLWDSDRLQSLQSDRIYQAGDAWMSSQDGVNDFPLYVHFPRMDFPVYSELGRLLRLYYGYGD